MTQISKRAIRLGALYFLGLLLVCALSVELFVRYWVIPRDFLYFKVEQNHFPYFRLTDEFQSGRVNITQGRRELTPRGSRAHKIAFVGDSNTFGLGASDSETFPEQLQQRQTTWDTHNFGVPGYGVYEVNARVKELSKEHFDVIAYNYNVNDAIVAMFLYLPLMGSAESRLTTMDAYEGSYGWLKLFAKDHIKSLFVFPALVGALAGPREISSVTPMTSDDVVAEDCFQSLSSQTDPLPKPYHVLSKIYADKKIQQRLAAKLKEMKTTVEKENGRFMVFLHHDLPLMTRLTDINDSVVNIFQMAGVDYIDTKPMYTEHYKECGFYSDPPHLGPKGNEYLAALLKDYLLRL